MKPILIAMFMGMIPLCINAQSLETKNVKTYIEIYSMHKASTPTIDTGDGKGKTTYTTEDGRTIEFYSSIGAVNWFVSNGWTLESQHMATCNDRTVKMYVVSKEIPQTEAQRKQEKYINK